jgi:hypothetical protein
MHKIADVRGGVSIKTSELGGDYLPEGAVLSAPDANGLSHVVKVTQLTEAATATDKTYKVKKHAGFAVGDFIMASVGSVAYAITSIDDTNKNYDVITVATTLGAALESGTFIMQAAARSTSTDSALKYVPFAIAGTGKPFTQDSNLDEDAWIFAVTKGHPLPEDIASSLKGIINY